MKKLEAKKLEANGFRSWLWESGCNPKHSKWLQQNMSDADIKFKTILKLIEGDADSFAERTELYYEKRPQLVKHVQDFYRVYHSLVEHYDHLTGNISQNVSKDFQSRHGILNDSPRSILFDKQLQLKAGDGPSNVPKSCSSLLVEMSQQVSETVKSNSGEFSEDLYAETQIYKGKEPEGSFPDMEYENVNQGTEKLPKALVNLRAKNDILKKECARLEEANDMLINKLTAGAILQEKLEEGKNSLEKERDELKDELTCRVQQISALKEAAYLSQEKDIHNQKKILEGDEQVQKLTVEIEFLQGQKQRLENEVLSGYEQENYILRAIQSIKLEIIKYVHRSQKRRVKYASNFVDYSRISDVSLKRKEEFSSLYEEVVDLSAKIAELLHELSLMQEKDERQKIFLLEIAEEKREAIRQLCSSMDMLNMKNKRLEKAINLFNRRSRNQNNGLTSTLSPNWTSFFSFEWMKPDPQSYALAL